MSWLGDWIRSNTTGARDIAPPPPVPMDGWSSIGRMLRALIVGVVALGVLAGAGWYYYAHRSLDWAIVVVAGDWRAHDGKPSEGFDNARRDIAAELRDKGFKAEDIVQFSVRPERYPDTHPLTASVQNIGDTLNQLAQNTNQGCLVYFSSHGAPWGLVLGGSFMNPQALSEIVDNTCGQKRPRSSLLSSFGVLFGHLRVRAFGRQPRRDDGVAARPHIVRLRAEFQISLFRFLRGRNIARRAQFSRTCRPGARLCGRARDGDGRQSAVGTADFHRRRGRGAYAHLELTQSGA